MKAKIANYTEAQVATITEMYKGEDNKPKLKKSLKLLAKPFSLSVLSCPLWASTKSLRKLKSVPLLPSKLKPN